VVETGVVVDDGVVTVVATGGATASGVCFFWTATTGVTGVDTAKVAATAGLVSFFLSASFLASLSLSVAATTGGVSFLTTLLVESISVVTS
jgi:hypothetical protein